MHNRGWTQNISFKIIVSVLVPLFFMGLGFLLILTFSISYWNFQSERESINRFMAGYSAALRNAFDLSDFDYIKSSLGEIGEMTEMHNIGLFRADGTSRLLLNEKDLPFKKDAKEIIKNYRRLKEDNPVWTFRYKSQNTGTVLRNVTVLSNKDSCLKCHDSSETVLGFLLADFSTNRLNRRFIIHIFQVMMVVIVTVLVMVVVLKVVLRKIIQQPLEEITAGLEGISIISGTIKQIEHNSQDEIGALVDAINGLAERHKYTKQELTSFYDGSYDPISPLDYEMNILSSTRVSDVIEKDIEIMYNNMTLKDVLSFMKGSTHNFFPVINERGEFQGVITLQDVRNVLMDPSMSYAKLAKDFMSKSDLPILTPEQDMKSAMDLFNANRASYISVIDGNTKLFLGILARRKILEILKQGLLKSVGI
ncbi:MAG: CBS domain-containing protein [bacterium]